MSRTCTAIICTAILIMAGALHGTAIAAIAADSIRPTITATRVSGPIKIDGVLNEPQWQGPGLTDFTQRDPVEGAAPSERTEVWVAYDDAALYVAARLYDSSPDSVITQVGRHDTWLDSDWFLVGLDSYHDRRTGFTFAVNPSGSVRDGTLFNDSWDDNSWDGVWSAGAKVDDKGWTVEMRIPYSQLRFPAQSSYTWGINFHRTIQRKNEEDYFVMIPKKSSGFVSKFADLQGIADINPPRKLEVMPYVASIGKFTDHAVGDPFNNGKVFQQNAGADLKLGLGSNLTLNATLNPDFGQVEVDPAVVNLTQFETFFDEKRPFFVEGSNFLDFGFGGANNNWGFNFGVPSFFYSRRIGRAPYGSVSHDGYVDYPDKTHIIGAAKLTGKVAEGWSLGALQAVTSREYARVDSAGYRFSDQVEPLAYYGVGRLLGEFDEGREAIGFIATTTARDLNEPGLVDNYNKRAYAFGTDGWFHLDQGKEWVMTGWLAGTRVEGTPNRMLAVQRAPLHYYQRPDFHAEHLDSNATSLSGYGGRVAINRQSSGGLVFNAALGVITPGFETNDLGFLFRTNVVNAHIVMGYATYEPDGIFRRKRIQFATFRSIDFDRDVIGQGYFVFYGGQLMNFWSFNGNVSYSPSFIDTRTTRGGPKVRNTNQWNANAFLSSDTRQPITYSVFGFGGRSESGGYIYNYGPQVDWKATPSLRLSFSPSYMRDYTMAQYIDQAADPTAVNTYGTRYLFATLDQREISAGIRADWAFSPTLSLQLYVQPLISVGHYQSFRTLHHASAYAYTVAETDYDESSGTYTIHPEGLHGDTPAMVESNPDFNYKSLRGNAVLRWEYFPGSAIYLVWTHQKTNVDDPGDYTFGRNFDNLITARGDNVFQIKMSYWWNP